MRPVPPRPGRLGAAEKTKLLSMQEKVVRCCLHCLSIIKLGLLATHFLFLRFSLLTCCLSDYQAKRKKILAEMKASEESYVASLHVLIRAYLRPLKTDRVGFEFVMLRFFSVLLFSVVCW